MTTRVISEASRNATLKDVARLAGVSVSTASKALNGRKDVGEATRVRVVHAAGQLAFSPNALAKGLIAQRSGTVGLLTSDLEGRFSIPILMGAEDAFGSDMTSVFLCDARGDAIREQHHLRALLSRRVDGLIVVGARPDVRSSLGHDLGVPVVYAYAPSDDPTDLSLVTDHYGGGELAVDHLLTTDEPGSAISPATPPTGPRRLGPAGPSTGSSGTGWSWPGARSSSARGRRPGDATPPVSCCAGLPTSTPSSRAPTRSLAVSWTRSTAPV